MRKSAQGNQKKKKKQRKREISTGRTQRAEAARDRAEKSTPGLDLPPACRLARPSRTEPSRTEPSRAEPSLVWPGQIGRGLSHLLCVPSPGASALSFTFSLGTSRVSYPPWSYAQDPALLWRQARCLCRTNAVLTLPGSPPSALTDVRKAFSSTSCVWAPRSIGIWRPCVGHYVNPTVGPARELADSSCSTEGRETERGIYYHGRGKRASSCHALHPSPIQDGP